MLEDVRKQGSLRHRPAKPPPATKRPTPRTRPERELPVPESETEHCKRTVEAEARHRLKRCVRDVAAGRH